MRIQMFTGFLPLWCGIAPLENAQQLIAANYLADDRLCAPWPTSPLSAAGELRVMKRAGEAPYVSDGLTVRIAYLCRGPQGADGSGPAQSEIDFVTPWTNVREIHIVKGEVPEVAASSTHPALQRQEWLQP